MSVGDTVNQWEKVQATVQAAVDAANRSHALFEAIQAVNNRRIQEMVETTNHITEQLESSFRPVREAVNRVLELTAVAQTPVFLEIGRKLDFERMRGTWYQELPRSWVAIDSANLAFEQVARAVSGLGVLQGAQEHVLRSLFEPAKFGLLLAEMHDGLLRQAAVASMSVRDELEAEANLPEGPLPAPRPTPADESVRKIAVLALMVAALVVMGKMEPKDGRLLLDALLLLLTVLAIRLPPRSR